MCVFHACKPVCHVCSAYRGWKKALELLGLGLQMLWATMCILGFKPRFSGRAVSVLNRWVISPAFVLLYFLTWLMCVLTSLWVPGTLRGQKMALDLPRLELQTAVSGWESTRSSGRAVSVLKAEPSLQRPPPLVFIFRRPRPVMPANQWILEIFLIPIFPMKM